MSAEIAKIRYLPLPRWITAVVLAAAVLAGGLLAVFPPRRVDSYIDIPSTAVLLVYTIGAIILGAWVATLEFGSGTLQRTLTAESDRNRVLGAKAAVLLVAAAAVGIAGAAAGGGLSHLASVHDGVKVDQGELAKAMFSILPSGMAAALVGFGFGLLTRSFGGGLSIAIAFVLVGDQLLNFIPGIKDYSFGQVTGDLANGIAQTGEVKHSVGVALIATVVWAIAIITPGWLYFARGDLK